MIAIFCGKLLEGEQPTVFGDGLQTRDYVYVGDVVAANLLAAESNATGAFNIGTGVETTVLDIVNALAPHAEASFEPRWRRSGRARCVTSRSTRRGRRASSSGPPRWESRTASSARSVRCARRSGDSGA